MINKITISNVATYPEAPTLVSDLSNINFFFGANGTGKSTIGRILGSIQSYTNCSIAWQGANEYEIMVYNKDFVDLNFHQSATLKGVFTLGQNNIETKVKIGKIKDEVEQLTKKIDSFQQTLEGVDGNGGKKSEITALETQFKEDCWKQKLKHDPKLSGALEGFRGNSKKFMEKILAFSASTVGPKLSLAEIEEKAATVFGDAPTVEQPINPVNLDSLLNLETATILSKVVIGKDDVDIAAMIKKLSNSDWVREGIPFFKINDAICPFCQQPTPDLFSKSLADYFDDSFKEDSKQINDLLADYSTESELLENQIKKIIESPSRFLNHELFQSIGMLLIEESKSNKKLIEEKKREPSRPIALKSLVETFSKVKAAIDEANAKVLAHNQMVNNLSQEKKDLTNAVWRHIVEVEIPTVIQTYKTNKFNLEKAVTGLTQQISGFSTNRRDKEKEIRELEKQTTSIQPTIDSINSILTSYGFTGFKVAEGSIPGTYSMIRPDGTPAKDTLSEGEKNFVTFLYFFFLLKGSMENSGMTKNRVVVFDDPVSSLDNEILFVVGSLIKKIFEEIRVGEGLIKQVFVLTHNVYFHKEVSFNPKRGNSALKEETFWIVRKRSNETEVKRYPTNPIKTSYELLWQELKEEGRTNLTIQNTMRRILENYFKILGGVDPEIILKDFEGEEKVICKSLFSWVNDGSHSSHDDFFVSIDDAIVDSYLLVFKRIFEKTNHFAHYQMMMGEAV